MVGCYHFFFFAILTHVNHYAFPYHPSPILWKPRTCCGAKSAYRKLTTGPPNLFVGTPFIPITFTPFNPLVKLASQVTISRLPTIFSKFHHDIFVIPQVNIGIVESFPPSLPSLGLMDLCRVRTLAVVQLLLKPQSSNGIEWWIPGRLIWYDHATRQIWNRNRVKYSNSPKETTRHQQKSKLKA